MEKLLNYSFIVDPNVKINVKAKEGASEQEIKKRIREILTRYTLYYEVRVL